MDQKVHFLPQGGDDCRHRQAGEDAPLRHSFAAFALRADDIRTVQELLEHSDERIDHDDLHARAQS